jgi:hypothetical protein
MAENHKKLFDTSNQFVLFSGTNLQGNGAFRHLNDLFLILYMLILKNISKEQIFLSIDLSILENLDNKTQGKVIKLLGKDYTFTTFFKEHIAKENFINANEFETTFSRGDNDLVFFASGHGAVNGLAIENYIDTKVNYDFLSSDYFEEIADDKNSTYLFLSQCQAGAFHHLDTRKKICVMGASEYQNSMSIPINLMYNRKGIENLSFEDNIAINPFLFSFFIIMINIENGIKHNKKKNIINIFKYIASSTIQYISNLYKNKKIIITKEFMESENSKLEYTVENLVIQQPFLLNKILASETFLD